MEFCIVVRQLFAQTARFAVTSSPRLRVRLAARDTLDSIIYMQSLAAQQRCFLQGAEPRLSARPRCSGARRGRAAGCPTGAMLRTYKLSELSEAQQQELFARPRVDFSRILETASG